MRALKLSSMILLQIMLAILMPTFATGISIKGDDDFDFYSDQKSIDDSIKDIDKL